MNGKEAIQALGCSRSWLHLLCRRGRVRFSKSDGRRYDYCAEDIRRVISEKRCTDSALPQRMADVLGFDLNELRGVDQSPQVSDRRRILCILLSEEGMTKVDIARFIHRSRASVFALLRNRHWVKEQADAARELWHLHK